VLTQFTMTANRSAQTSSSALRRTVPMRAPVVLLRRTDSSRTHQRQNGTYRRCCIPPHRLIASELAVRIIVSAGTEIAQIPIAHRHG
jgi:hypothetical protein